MPVINCPNCKVETEFSKGHRADNFMTCSRCQSMYLDSYLNDDDREGWLPLAITALVLFVTLVLVCMFLARGVS